jgi:pantoate--beta-alanine ligase
MRIINTTLALKNELDILEKNGKIGFVPTMGYLHEGHLSLVDLARKDSDFVVVSIFVNPSQFNDRSDFLKYPVDIERDLELLKSRNVDIVFLPSADQIYQADSQTVVMPGPLGQTMEGAYRPGHFSGVLTVVSILFNLVRPAVAVFGEKDFQQLRLIEQMVKDLHFNIQIVRGETVRESGGLALSSRNARLSEQGRLRASQLYKSLKAAVDTYQRGTKHAAHIKERIIKELEASGAFEVEYCEIANGDSLIEVPSIAPGDRIFIAVKIEGVRLIDNLEFV